MSIKIIDDQPDIYLTQAEYDRLMYEYRHAFTHYAGPIPSFENWVRGRQRSTVTNAVYIPEPT